MNVHPSIFCKQAIETLDKSTNFADDFVRLKFEFFREYQNPHIFSTRFGADFFSIVYDSLMNNNYLAPEKGEILGEFDKNFNAWLKIARQIK